MSHPARPGFYYGRYLTGLIVKVVPQISCYTARCEYYGWLSIIGFESVDSSMIFAYSWMQSNH